MRPIILSSLLATFLWSSPVGGVAVLVKNSPITLNEIKEEMNRTHASAQQSADALIRKKLEQLEAQERKITVSNSEIDEETARMAGQNNLSKEQFVAAMQNVRGISEKELREKIEENIRGQKLYSAIAFSKMAQPTAQEEADYYELHSTEFSRPESFDVTTYIASSEAELNGKIADPMRHFESIQSKDETIPYAKINPQLGQLLNRIPDGSFGPVLPDGNGKFMAFYMKSKNNVVTEPLDSVRSQIDNMILGDKRNQVLNDYFTRLRLNADIRTLRLPE